MDIKNTIYKMLTESTGISMMDSGGGEGRHWQKNIKKSQEDFENEPQVTIDNEDRNETINSREIEYTISVYHYLTNGGLELNELCEKFNSLPNKDWDSEIYGVSKAQAKWLDRQGFEVGDSFNTYNYNCSLSQTLQGTYVKLGVDTYVLLQIHQGADVRGGYTDAKMFYLPEDYMPSESVYGEVEGYQIDNSYDGETLTDSDGQGLSILVKPKDKIELHL